MMRSLENYGQLSPVVVLMQEGRCELIDGFKRLGAARKLPSMDRLLARRIEADERAAKAAIYGLNRAGCRPRPTAPVAPPPASPDSPIRNACRTSGADGLFPLRHRFHRGG